MTPHNSLQPLHDLDITSPHFHEQLVGFLHGYQFQSCFPTLQEDHLTWLVEYLDRVLLDISDPASFAFQISLHELGRVCSIREVLPKSCVLSDTDEDVGSTASGCICEGTLDASRVRVERIRTQATGDPQKVKEAFHRVAVLWKHMEHPNVVPLLGVTIDPLRLISTSMPGGNLMEHIASHPTVDKISLLSGIAEGLNHLHQCSIIHGDLKGSNILVDAAGLVRVTDFGLATVTHDLDSIRNGLDEHRQCARWMAPEILDGQETYSKEADVFSFAMVTIEVFTGTIPFGDKPSHAAMQAIVGGERPTRPTDPTLTDRLWELTQRCWDQDMRRRPHALRISCSFGVPAWKRLIGHPHTANERIPLIADLLSDRDEVKAIKRLSMDEAQSFVDILDEMLDKVAPWLRRKCLSTLCRVCGHRALLPRSVQISLRYNRTDAPRYQGGFAEVWKTEHEGRDVAVKVLKVYVTSDLVKITRKFCNEVVTWKSLRHQNVLPLLGVMMSGNHLTMVSEWMANGNINEFIKAHRDANRFDLLKDVALGLMYMHGQVMVHGDLKGANILIDNDGHARLADFGLITIVSDSTNTTTSSSTNSGGTTRWMSPELFYPEKFGLKDNRRTKESDCYALGMVILEVLTSKAPFPQDDGFVITRKVVDGERPERPQGPEAAWFTNDLWEMLEQCWSPGPKLRPTVEVVLECLGRSSMAWHPLPPSADDDFQLDDDRDSFSTMSHLSPNQTISHDDDQPTVLPRSPPHDVNIDQALPRSPPVSRQSESSLLEDGWEATRIPRNLLEYSAGPGLSLGPQLATLTPSTFSDGPGMPSAARLFAVFTEGMAGRVDPGIFDPILHLISSEDIEVQGAAIAALRNFSANTNDRLLTVELDDNKTRSAESGTFTWLMALARSKNTLVQRNATAVLLNLTYQGECSQHLVNVGVIPVLVELLNSPDPEVQYNCTAALSNITADDVNRKELAQCEPMLVQDLVQLIDSPSFKVKCQATLALRNLAIDENYQLEIVRTGGLAPLLRSLQLMSLPLVLCVVACAHNMSIHPMNKFQILEAGFLQPLIALLSFDDSEVQYHAMATLRHLASGSEEIQLTIFKTGIAHTIKELVLKAPKNVQSEMAAFVACLALNGELNGQLLRMGICEVLIPLAKSRSPGVQANSGAALANLSSRGRRVASHSYLAFNEVWDKPEGGMHHYLYQFLNKSDATFQYTALWTIVQLLESGDPRLINKIRSSPLLVPHIRKFAASDVSTPSSSIGVPRSRGPDSDQKMDVVGEEQGEIQLLSRKALEFIDGDTDLSTTVGVTAS